MFNVEGLVLVFRLEVWCGGLSFGVGGWGPLTQPGGALR